MPAPTHRSPPRNRLSSPLPKRFPVGASYVVEGQGGEDGRLRVISRYVVLPGGRRINVPADLGPQAAMGPQIGRDRRGRSGIRPTGSRAKKIMERAGTSGQQRN